MALPSPALLGSITSIPAPPASPTLFSQLSPASRLRTAPPHRRQCADPAHIQQTDRARDRQLGHNRNHRWQPNRYPGQHLRRTNASLSRRATIDDKVAADQRCHGLGVSLEVYSNQRCATEDRPSEAPRIRGDSINGNPRFRGGWKAAKDGAGDRDRTGDVQLGKSILS